MPSSVNPEARALLWVALHALTGTGWLVVVEWVGQEELRVKPSEWFPKRGAREASQEARICGKSSAHTQEDCLSQAELSKGF